MIGRSGLVGATVRKILTQFDVCSGKFWWITSSRPVFLKEIGWYDQRENQPGNLASRLATDASFVKSVTGVRLGIFGEAFVTLVASLVIAFVFGWQLTLVILAFVPLLIIAGVIQVRKEFSFVLPKIDEMRYKSFPFFKHVAVADKTFIFSFLEFMRIGAVILGQRLDTFTVLSYVLCRDTRVQFLVYYVSDFSVNKLIVL